MSTSRLLALIALTALAAPVAAQDSADPAVATSEAATPEAATPEAAASAPAAVAAALTVEVLKPELDEAGQPVLDASGQPVLAFQPVEGAALLPGDEFRYHVVLDNQGPEVEAMEVALDLPAGARLLPESVTASGEAGFELGAAADPALREPLFVEMGGARVPNPLWVEAPERFDQLRVEIERIASGATATVTYHLVVR